MQKKKNGKTDKLNKILTLIIISFAAIIVAGTAAGFISKKAKPGKNLRDADPAPTEKSIENLNKKNTENIAAYTGIDTLRIVTSPASDNSDDMGTVIVVTPWFAYPEGDTVFFEELSRKRILITGLITTYFNQRTAEELMTLTEEKIKADLMETINSQLSLGKISQIYFTDYIFL